MIYLNARSARLKERLAAFVGPAWLWAGLVFLLALLPRLYALGSFLTIDEVKWAEGAAQFLLALASGRLAETYWHFHPGITITWGSALALWAACAGQADLAGCALDRVEHLAGTIGWLRLSPALLTSLGVAGVYLLGRRLAGETWALLAALLLAFDPFFIAHSRILNGDAGAAILMFLSLLAFLDFLLRPAARPPAVLQPSLLLSAFFAGLAWLTKLPSPLIGLFVAGLGLLALLRAWRRFGPAPARRWLLVLAIWFGVAGATFGLLWPAMWVAPLQTLRLMVADSFSVGEVGSGHDTFFLGRVVADPGPWFYPYVIAFRLTPVTTVGLVAGLGWLLGSLWSGLFSRKPGAYAAPAGIIAGNPPPRSPFSPRFWGEKGVRGMRGGEGLFPWLLLAFVVFVILLANVSPKKLDRYVMSVVPPLIFLAAFGFVKLARAMQARYQPPALDGLVILQLILAILAAPYFLTYYNPLLGGVGRAVRQIPVGWGEGLERAAYYLNGLPGAESLVVSSWYSDIFNPYFVGQRASFSDDGRAQLAADYVVFYANQVQRQKPYPGLVDYFRARPPVFVLSVDSLGQAEVGQAGDGAPWVEVYRAPAARSAGGAPKIEGVAQLLAYKISGGRVVEPGPAGHQVAGDLAGEATVTLYLRVLGPLPDGSRLGAALSLPASGQEVDWRAVPAGEISGAWREGAVVEWRGRLALPLAAPAGEYRLRVGLLAGDGPALAELLASENDPPIIVAGPE